MGETLKFKPIHFKVGLFLFSLFLALALTAGYGWLKHKRYYDVTISWTQKNQIKFAKSLLKFAESKAKGDLYISPNDFSEAFKPMKRYMPVDIYLNGEIYFSQRYERKVNDRPVKMDTKKFKVRDYEIVFGLYGRPNWFFGQQPRFWIWLLSPKNWFSWRYDYIWQPFIFFFTTVFFLAWAGVYRYRARFVDKVLLEEIRAFKSKD